MSNRLEKENREYREHQASKILKELKESLGKEVESRGLMIIKLVSLAETAIDGLEKIYEKEAHITALRSQNGGHGVTASFDISRETLNKLKEQLGGERS